jgi:hypothetical protein
MELFIGMRSVVFKLLLLVSILGISGCTSSDPNESFIFKCEEKVKTESFSNNEKYAATVSLRGCGATTNDSTAVNIRHKSESFAHSEGLVFIIERDNYVRVKWLKDDHLSIEYYPIDKIFKKETKWNDIKISYYILKK